MSDINDLLNVLLSADSDKTDDNNDDAQESVQSSGENGSNSGENGSNSGENDFFGGIDIDAIMKFGEILSKMNESDKNTELLIALKPHLREENRAKIDTAVKLFRLISLLPYLKETGLFDNLF